MKAVQTWRKRALFLACGVFSSASVFAENEDATLIETIKVTGERVERSLVDTASSVAVFDEQYLAEQAGADRIEQIMDLAPNLQRGSHDIGVAIRGQDTTGVLIGANAFLGGTRPRASLQIDGRALNFNEFIYGLASIWDVERIEVFRGPQTTTQGRNAIAGAIFIETKDPTFEFEGKAQLLGGNYDTGQASLSLSGPLIKDELAGRFSIDARQQDSWMRYTAPDVFVGADREDDAYINARGKLLFTPSAIPELEVLVTLTHLDANNPQGETADLPYDKRIQNVQNGAHWETEVTSAVLDADYELSDNWSINVMATLADAKSQRYAAPGFGTALVEADEYALETLLYYTPEDSKLSAVMGISHFAADQDEASDLSAFLGLGDFSDDQTSTGIFAEGTYHINDQLRFTLGARWQKDNQDRSGTLGPVALDYDEDFSEFLPKAEVAYNITDDIVVGATVRKGFNPGGTTISFVTGAVDDFAEESLWSYELFTRASLADGDLILSGNLFYTDFEDAQRPLITVVTLPGGGTAETTQFSNAPSADSVGLELSGIWRANDWLQVRGSLGLQDTEITDTNLPNDPIRGQEFQRAPGFSASLAFHMQPTNALTVDLSVRHNSDYYSDDANTPDFEIDSVTIVDAKASYRFNNANAFVFVRNATDEDYQVWQFRAGNSSLGDPMEYGLGVELSF